MSETNGNVYDELLRAERDREGAPPEARREVAARLDAILRPHTGRELDKAPHATRTSALPSASSGTTAWGKLVGSFVVGGLIGAAVGGSTVRAIDRSNTAADRETTRSPASRAEPEAPATTAAAVVEPPPLAPNGHVERTSVSRARPSGPDGSGPTTTQRSREQAIIERARAALARGDSVHALDATSEHLRTFPTGEFAEERETIAIQALARSGDRAAAGERAGAFRKKYPDSILRDTVDRALR